MFHFFNNYMISAKTIQSLACIYSFSPKGKCTLKIKLLQGSFALPKARTNKKSIYLKLQTKPRQCCKLQNVWWYVKTSSMERK